MDVFKVLIVDDHAHARAGIREILSQDERYEIVAEANDGEQAVQATTTYRPDLIIMDIQMNHLDGLEATRLIKAIAPDIKIVIVTVSDNFTDLFEAIKNGAQGYLIKNLRPSMWLEYLNAIMLDEAPLPKELAHQMLVEFMNQSQSQAGNDIETLTEREHEILQHVAGGNTNRDISVMLHISEHTVKNHLRNIMRKLHVANRVQLTNVAYKAGIVK